MARFVTLAVVVLGASAAVRALVTRFEERLRAAIAGVSPTDVAGTLSSDVLLLSAPLLGVAAAGAIVVGLAQTGGAVVAPWGRSRRGFAALFDGERWLSALRGGAVAVAILVVALVALRDHAVTLVDGKAYAAPVMAFVKLALAVLAMGAALDVAIRRSAWRDRWRLTPEAAREERRNEQTPELARHARQRLHEELMHPPPRSDAD